MAKEFDADFDFTMGEEFFPLDDSTTNLGNQNSRGNPGKVAGIKSFFKNVTKSVKNLAVDITDDFAPNITGFAREMKEFATTTKDNVTRTREAYVERYGKYVEQSMGGNQGKAMTNLREKVKVGFQEAGQRIKSGDFYRNADENTDMSGLFGDFDAGNLSSNNDGSVSMDAEPTKSKREQPIIFSDTSGSAMVADATISVGDAQMKHQNQLFAKQYKSDEMRFRTGLKYQQAILDRLTNINLFLSKIESQNVKAAMEHRAKDLALSQDMLALLKEMRDATMVSTVAQKQTAETMYEQVFGSGFSGSGYAGAVAKNAKNRFDNSMLGSIMGMADMGLDMSDTMKSTGIKTKFDPMSMLLKNGVKSLLGKTTRIRLSQMNEIFGGLGGLLTSKMNEVSRKSSNPFVQTIASILGVNDSVRRVGMGIDDPNARATFDAQTHRSINVVIPGYLSKLLAATTGGEETFYDMKTGGFKTASSSIKKFRQDVDMSYKTNYSYNKFGASLSRTADGEKLGARLGIKQEDLDKDFEQILKNIVDSGQGFSLKLAIGDKGYQQIMMKGIKNKKSFAAFVEAFKKMNPMDRLLIGHSSNVRANVDSTIRNYEMNGMEGSILQNEVQKIKQDSVESALSYHTSMQSKNKEGFARRGYEQRKLALQKARYEAESGNVKVMNLDQSLQSEQERALSGSGGNSSGNILKKMYELLLSGVLVYPSTMGPGVSRRYSKLRREFSRGERAAKDLMALEREREQTRLKELKASREGVISAVTQERNLSYLTLGEKLGMGASQFRENNALNQGTSKALRFMGNTLSKGFFGQSATGSNYKSQYDLEIIDTQKRFANDIQAYKKSLNETAAKLSSKEGQGIIARAQRALGKTFGKLSERVTIDEADPDMYDEFGVLTTAGRDKTKKKVSFLKIALIKHAKKLGFVEEDVEFILQAPIEQQAMVVDKLLSSNGIDIQIGAAFVKALNMYNEAKQRIESSAFMGSIKRGVASAQKGGKKAGRYIARKLKPLIKDFVTKEDRHSFDSIVKHIAGEDAVEGKETAARAKRQQRAIQQKTGMRVGSSTNNVSRVYNKTINVDGGGFTKSLEAFTTILSDTIRTSNEGLVAKLAPIANHFENNIPIPVFVQGGNIVSVSSENMEQLKKDPAFAKMLRELERNAKSGLSKAKTGFFKGVFGGIASFTKKLGSGAGDLVKGTFGGFASGVKGFGDRVGDFLKGGRGKLEERRKSVVNSLSALAKRYKIPKESFKELLHLPQDERAKVLNDLVEAGNLHPDAVSEFITLFSTYDAIKNKLHKGGGILSEAIGSAKTFAGKLLKAPFEVGSKIIDKIKDKLFGKEKEENREKKRLDIKKSVEQAIKDFAQKAGIPYKSLISLASLPAKERQAVLDEYVASGSLSAPMSKALFILLSQYDKVSTPEARKGLIRSIGSSVKSVFTSSVGAVGNFAKGVLDKVSGGIKKLFGGAHGDADGDGFREGSLQDRRNDQYKNAQLKYLEQISNDVRAIRKVGFGIGGSGKKELDLLKKIANKKTDDSLVEDIAENMLSTGAIALGSSAATKLFAKYPKLGAKFGKVASKLGLTIGTGAAASGAGAAAKAGSRLGSIGKLGGKALGIAGLAASAYFIGKKFLSTNQEVAAAGGGLGDMGYANSGIGGSNAMYDAMGNQTGSFDRSDIGSQALGVLDNQMKLGNVARNSFKHPVAASKGMLKFMKLVKGVVGFLMRNKKIAAMVGKIGANALVDAIGRAAKKVAHKLTAMLAKIAGAAVPGVQLAVYALYAADFLSGMANARRYFRLPRGADPTVGMRIASGLANAFLLTGEVAPLIYSVIGSRADKDFLAEADRFAERKARLLGVSKDGLVEYESRTVGERLFSGDKRWAKVLGFSSPEEFKTWRDTKYRVVDEAFKAVQGSAKYRGLNVTSTPSSPMEAEGQKAFREDALKLASSRLSKDASVREAASAKKKSGTDGSIAAAGAASALLGPESGVDSSSASVARDTSSDYSAMQSVGATAGAIATGAAAGSSPDGAKGSLAQSPVLTRAASETSAINSELAAMQELLREQKRHNGVSEEYLDMMTKNLSGLLRVMMADIMSSADENKKNKMDKYLGSVKKGGILGLGGKEYEFNSVSDVSSYLFYDSAFLNVAEGK